MNEMQLFNFNNHEVRTLIIENEPYFVGKDVAGILGYADASKAVSQKVDKEDKRKEMISHYRNGKVVKTQTTFINESGLYSLILSSKLPQAKEFKRWVTSEVLPTIRKHGMYANTETVEKMLEDPSTMITVLERLKKEQDEKKELAIKYSQEKESRLIAEQQVKELKPKADYMDKILQNKSLFTITQIAKDYGMSGRKMNEILHNLGIQYKQGGTWLLYSKHQAKGWTQSETTIVEKNDGTEKAVMTTKWTQKGRIGLYELLKKNDVVPMIEQA